MDTSASSSMTTVELMTVERAAHDRAILLLESHVKEVVKKPLADIEKRLRSFRNWLRWLVGAVILMAFAVSILGAGLYGVLVNYWGGDAMFYGFVAMGTALLGFIAGWIARR